MPAGKARPISRLFQHNPPKGDILSHHGNSYAEVVHGAPYRFADPARFSLAHGGKDRHPFPVPLTVYDQTIRVLKTTVAKARLGREAGCS
jgi:hypothetical protein